MAESDKRRLDSLDYGSPDRPVARSNDEKANDEKAEPISLAEKRALLEKLKDSGFDSAFVFHEDNHD